MHLQVNQEEREFHDLQAEYLGEYSKAERDAAQPGSGLSDLQVEVSNYPSELMRLKLLGLGSILTGIFLSLLAIVVALMMMPGRMGNIMSSRMKEMMDKQMEMMRKNE